MLVTMLTTVAALATTSTVQQDFAWRGTIAAGKTVEIRSINGDVRAGAASGGTVEVTATKRGPRSEADEVRIEVVEHARGVTICALHPSRHADRPNECAPGGGRHSSQDDDVRVHFEVRLPAGVHFAGHTVNGDVSAEGLTGDARVGTVNGGIDISTSGQAEAQTVNGSITARIGVPQWRGDLEFRTVNGSVTVVLPADAGAEVQIETLNGGITTDFPLTVEGRMASRRIRGTIGSGGGGLRLATINGEVRLRRAS
jgi:DUF4097 and DUF4098 domain-containing protein YvlB